MCPESKETSILKFWLWFRKEAARLAAVYENGRVRDLTEIVSASIDRIDPGLAWEIGPGKKTKHSFTISAEGNPDLRPVALAIVRAAPTIPGWEFYGAKQSREAPPSVRLPDRDLTVSTKGWRFIPKDDFELGRVHLTILDEGLDRLDREAALLSVTLFLDAFLGEEEVERWIGALTISSATKTEKSYVMRDLPDYILWATHRDKRPLKKP